MVTDIGGIPMVQTSGGYGGGYGGGFGGDGIWAILLLSLLGGRGFGGGFGNGGGNCGCGCGCGCGNSCCDKELDLINTSFNSRFNSLQETIDHNSNCDFQREIEGHICDVNSNLANLIAANNLTACQGFGSVNSNIVESKYQNALGQAAIQKDISDCCCEVLRGEDQIRFEAAQNTCAIMQNADCNAQKIIDKMTCAEIQNLRDSLQAERLSASQCAQNAYLVNAIKPCPIPAYPACNPYAPAPFAPFGGFGGYGGRGFNDGCGCGCGCGCN